MYLRSPYNNVLYTCIHINCYNRLVHCGYIHCTQCTVIIQAHVYTFTLYLRSASIIISNVCNVHVYICSRVCVESAGLLRCITLWSVGVAGGGPALWDAGSASLSPGAHTLYIIYYYTCSMCTYIV